MRCIPPAKSIPVGSGAPVPPAPSDSAARPSHQRPSALPFPARCSSSTGALPAVPRENGPAGEGLQSRRGHRRMSPRGCAALHGRSPAIPADRCAFPAGLCDLLCQMLATPMCFFVPAVTAAPSPQLHFQSGSHMFGLCGERGPAAQLSPTTPIFLLFPPFSLTLGLHRGTPSEAPERWQHPLRPSSRCLCLRADWEELEFPLSCPRAALELQSS